MQDEERSLNRYVQSRGRSYTALVSALKEFCSSNDKKNAKILHILRDLTLFRVEPSIFEALLQLLSLDDKKALRYVHYFLCQIAQEETMVFQSTAALEQEARHTSNMRKLCGLVTLAHFAGHKDSGSLLPLLLDDLTKAMAKSVEEKEKEALRTQNTRG
eukprot:JP446893.1.p1 GENE.JP446893.1~~JP446893.1.p1  ORF type:complete len:169 (-),score=25.86 JP446893.1:293-769(-)